MATKSIVLLLGRIGFRFSPFRRGAAAEESPSDRINAPMTGVYTQSSHLTMRLETDLRTRSRDSRASAAQP
jgi:hypothetical protein